MEHSINEADMLTVSQYITIQKMKTN